MDQDSNITTNTNPTTPSSVGWGIAALLTAWTGLIGLVLGIMATAKGFSKKSANTANGILGILSILIALGAIGFQLLFGIALVFGTDKNDLGAQKTTVGTVNGVSYTMQLPEKFTREKVSDEEDRFIYRIKDTDIVRAILIVSCTTQDFSETSNSDMLDALHGYVSDLSDDKDTLADMSTSFGGIKNITVGSPELISNGPYASKGYAVSLYGVHPISNDSMYGEMHIMYADSYACSGAWLATKDIHTKNELKMDETLTSLKLN